MRNAAPSCGMERNTCHLRASGELTLQQLIDAIWATKVVLVALQWPSTPDAHERNAHLWAFLTKAASSSKYGTPTARQPPPKNGSNMV